ncbi:20655_t:CDS:2 [Gigaspora rosea]|nr:20655_t:CDS:2 [Gigaspora rosea]
MSHCIADSNFTFPVPIYEDDLLDINQYDDNTLLITTQKIPPINNTDSYIIEKNLYLYLFFTNGSIIPIKYENLSSCNGSNFALKSYPLSTNYILMMCFVNNVYHGIVIDWHGTFKSSQDYSSVEFPLSEPTYSIRSTYGSSAELNFPLSISPYNYLLKGFLTTIKPNNDDFYTNVTYFSYLNWTKYDFTEEGNVVQHSNGTIKADDVYFIINHFVFNTIDGHYAIAYVVINIDVFNSTFGIINPEELNFNPKDTEKPRMSLYANVIKDGIDQKILLFQYYDKFLERSSILGCHAGFNSFDIQSSICFISLNFDFRTEESNIRKFIKFSTSGSVIQTDDSNSLSIIIKDAKQFIKDSGFNNPAILSTQPEQNKTLTFLSSNSTTATLKLNLNQSFYQQIKDDLYRQIITSLPIDSNRLYITGNVQPDFVDSNILIEFSVIKTTDSSNEPSVNDIINDLNDMIKNKDTSALFGQKYTMFLDSNYGFQIKANLWDEVKFKLLAAAIVMFLLFIIYYFVRKINSEGNNMFIFKIVFMILDFILDILFIVVNGRDVQVLFVPRLSTIQE